MKLKLLLFGLLISVIASAQHKPNYIYRPVREHTIAQAPDSILMVPKFSRVRLADGLTNGATGSIFADTVRKKVYVVFAGVPYRLRDSTESTGSGSGGGIQSIDQGYGITVTNDSLVKVDSATLSAKYVRQGDSATVTNPQGWVKGKSLLGDMVSTTFASSTGFNTTTGAATISYSSGLNISGGNGSFDNNRVYSAWKSQSNNYSITAELTINTKPANHTEGVIIEKFGTIRMYVRLKYKASDSCRLELRCVNGTGDGTAFDSTEAVSMANGANYRITIAQASNSIYFRIARIVSTLETEIKAKNFTIPVRTFYQLPSVGGIGVGVLGGDYKVTLLKLTNYELIGSDVAIVGTSISQAYSPTSFSNHYIIRAFDGSGKTFINFGSAGGGFTEGLTAVNEIFAAQPKAIGVEFGVNDAAAGLRAAANTYWDTLAAHGYSGANGNVFWIKDFYASNKDSIMYNIARERNIPLYDPGINMTSTMFDDGVHPNDEGMLYMAKFLKSAGPQFFGVLGRTDQASFMGLRDVYFNGTVTGDIPQYNATTGKWNNATLASLGANWIQNQQASAQSGNMWISGNGSFNSFLSVGAQATGNFKLEIQENASNGTGLYITNTNSSSGATKAFQMVLKGSSAAEGSNWNNAGALEAVPNGGLILSAYNNVGIQFLIGTRTVRGLWNTTGLAVGHNSPDRLLHPEVSDATTNTMIYPLRVGHTTSGTNAIGSGVGVEFENENASGTMKVTASIETPFTDATNASEDADIVLKAIRAGTLTEGLRVLSTGDLSLGRAQNTTDADSVLSVSGGLVKSVDLSALATASSGTYTPTLSNGTNVTGTPTVNRFQYMRVGSVVTVSGSVTYNATATTSTSFELTLPVASTFSVANSAAGTCTNQYGQQGAGAVIGISTHVQVSFTPATTGNRDIYIHWTYLIE